MTTPLRRGDLLPHVVTPPPGPRSRRLSRRLERYEAPGINTVPLSGASIQWHSALGANVLDVDGNRYVDLTAGFGVAAVGHRHPRVASAVRRQTGALLHGLADVHGHALRADLARELTAIVPVENPRVYFAISGSDAVEVALKTAVLATGRPGIVAFEPAYHGLTLGALHPTARDAFRRPFAAHLHRHLRRLPYGCDPGRVAAALGRDSACAILEPIVGREGVIVPPRGWLGAVAAACHARGALLIADEIFTGFGRTGRWFALDEEGVRPDLLCCGKALGGGLPIGAVAGRRELMDAWRTPGEALHTATFVANPLSCAAALAVLGILKRQRLPERARRLGRALAKRLAAWPRLTPAIREIRGRGLLWGIELDSAEVAATVVTHAARRGVLALAGGPEARVLQIVPPLTITERQLTTALDLLEASLPPA